MIMNGQSRAARSLLGWTQADLAGRSGVSLASVKRAEAGASSIPIIESAIAEAFMTEGVVFLDRGDVYEGRMVIAGVLLVQDPA